MPNIGIIPAGLFQGIGRPPVGSSLPIGLMPGGQGSGLTNPGQPQMTSFRNSAPFTQETLQRVRFIRFFYGLAGDR